LVIKPCGFAIERTMSERSDRLARNVGAIGITIVVAASRLEQVQASVAEGYVMPDPPVPFFARNKIHFGADTHVSLTVRALG
jgi:hypothetical protein